MQFSIIIPVYNVEQYLRECLDSVLGQTFEHWQAICIDDGSTDSSGKILDEYARKDPRIIVAHKANSGVSQARNLALSLATGDWITFLDSDDIFNPRYLEVADAAISRSPADFYRFNRKDFVTSCSWGDEDVGIVDKFLEIDRTIPSVLYEIGFFQGLYRRDLLNGLYFNSQYIRGEDRLFLGQYLTRVKMAVWIASVMYGYRQRENSAMSQISPRVIVCEMNFRRDLIQYVKAVGKEFDPQIRRLMTLNYLSWIPNNVRYLGKEDRHLILKQWYSNLGEIDCKFWLPVRSRITIVILRLIRTDWWSWAICVLPVRMKLLGFRVVRMFHADHQRGQRI